MKKFLKVVGLIVLGIVALVLLAYAGIFAWSLAMPEVPPVAMVSSPNPATSYADAIARFDAYLAEEEARGDIDPKCLPFLLTHGQQTEHAIVLYHGLTACPYQYHEFAQLLYDEGYNVFVPRLPRHGYADRLGNPLADLTAEELLSVMDPNMDIAVGLGDKVTMAGLSLGGNVAAAGGQLRDDLYLGMPMSPAFGIRFAPNFLTPAITRLLLGLPDIYMWWDPINKENFQADTGYPGFSLHALAQIFRLGISLRDLAATEAPAAQNLLMVTNWGDPAINLGAAEQLVDEWRGNGATVATYRFPLIPWLPHDIISTDAVGGRVDITYPKLLELITSYP